MDAGSWMAATAVAVVMVVVVTVVGCQFNCSLYAG